MDCTIPSNGVKTVSYAIGCLCRIGKELYTEYSALEGLTLRSLNDAKSAFASFHFDPSFFERCSAPASGSSGSRPRKRPRRRHRVRGRIGRRSNGEREGREDGDKEDEEETDEKYTCRIPLRIVHSILRPRKGLLSLRIRSAADPDNTPPTLLGDENDNNNRIMQLWFEFVCETVGPMRVTRKIGVEECEGISAVASTIGTSQIVADPAVFAKMLQPLCRTAELALTVDHRLQIVTASSFHHSDTALSNSDTPLLASNAVLKTETSMQCHEFLQYSFRDDRPIDSDQDIPPDVNQQVTLVFGIKEVKAMLQFASQCNTDNQDTVTLSFEWGGRPVIFESEGESFSAQLIMATLDHKLLSNVTQSSHQNQ